MAKKDFRRKSNIKPQNPRFLIVCEGAVTEIEYLEAVKRSRRIRSADIELIPPGPTSPLEIVTRARDLRDGSRHQDAFDAVWCIFDVEAKVLQKARPGLASALKMAKDNRISIALSNPCVELWILLHTEDHQSWICSDNVQRRCLELALTNRKHLLDAEQLLRSYSSARERAMNLESKHDREGRLAPEDRNPSTGVYELVDAIYESFPSRT